MVGLFLFIVLIVSPTLLVNSQFGGFGQAPLQCLALWYVEIRSRTIRWITEIRLSASLRFHSTLSRTMRWQMLDVLRSDRTENQSRTRKSHPNGRRNSRHGPTLFHQWRLDQGEYDRIECGERLSRREDERESEEVLLLWHRLLQSSSLDESTLPCPRYLLFIVVVLSLLQSLTHTLATLYKWMTPAQTWNERRWSSNVFYFSLERYH